MHQPNLLLVQSKAAIALLRFLGLFPILINKLEEIKSTKIITSILYFILFYAFSMFISIRQMLRRVYIISSKKCDFDCLIFSTATLIVLIPTMLIPFAFWFHTRRTITFWDNCYAFQIRYELLLGKSIPIRVKNFVTFFVIASVIIVLVVTTLPSAFIANFSFVATSTYYFIFGGFIAGVAYWLSGCSFLKQVADNILQFLDESFKTGFVQKKNIAICYELWATAQDLLKEFGSSMESFLMIYGFTLMLTMLNAMYGFVSQLYTTELKTKNIRHACGHFILFVWSSTLIFVLNESSYQVINTFTHKFKKQILLMNMNYLGSTTKNQVVEFYQIFRNTNSKLSFSGFNEFSRAFFITILSVIITYMVIMLQIRNDYLLSQKQAPITRINDSRLTSNCTE